MNHYGLGWGGNLEVWLLKKHFFSSFFSLVGLKLLEYNLSFLGLSRKSPFSSSSATGAIPKTQDNHRKSPHKDILAEKASPKSSKKSGGLNNVEEHKIFDKETVHINSTITN